MLRLESRWISSMVGRSTPLLALAAAACLTACLAGCASGSSSVAGSPPVVAPVQNANPPSLPPLAAATKTNTYVGPQVMNSASPANVVSLKLDETVSTYTYANVALPNTPPNPVANSMGLTSLFQDYTQIADTTGLAGQGGPQYFGLVAEQASRFALFAPNSGQQMGVLVPMQSSSCVTPTAAATYQFVTLFNSGFAPATDTAWGTVSIAASGTGFTFTNAQQFTQASAAASTSLIPFAPSTCTQSTPNPALGYFIDTPASAATSQIEVQSFLGPTGILVSNLEGTDGSGNPLPLASVFGMVQPASAVDLKQVTGTAATGTVYRSLFYQPTGSPAVQYGYVGQASANLFSVDDTIFTLTGQAGILGAWEGTTSFSSLSNPTEGIVFGAQDPKNPGLFPNALFVYDLTTNGGTCPTGTTYFAGYQPVNSSASFGYCSSPAVAMIGLHDGKYVILMTGAFQPQNNAPTVLILIEG